MVDKDRIGPEGRPPSGNNTSSMARRFFTFRRSPASVFRLTRMLATRRNTARSNSNQAAALPIPLMRFNELTPSICLEKPLRPTTDLLRRWTMLEDMIKYESHYLHTLIVLTLDCFDELIQDETILPQSKAREIFAYLPEMRVLHQHFRIWIAEGARHWNEREMVGWFFGALLEQPALLNAYTMFVANYKRAITVAEPELTKRGKFCNFMESRLRHVEPKLTFGDFFMKPIQRMVHMERHICEMLRETPVDHPDLPMLRLCSKRAKYIVSELDVLEGHISLLRSVLEPEFPAILPTAGNASKRRQSQLLHCEELCKVVYNRQGVRKEKIYRIYLLNDRVVYAAVLNDKLPCGRVEQMLRVKWILPLAEIEFHTVSTHGALHSHQASDPDPYMEMVRLLVDSSILTKIGSLVDTLHHSFSGLSLSTVERMVNKCGIEMERIDRDARIADECYDSRQLLVSPRQDTSLVSRGKTHLVQFPDPTAKWRWYCHARLAQRALHSAPYSSVWWTDVNQLFATNEPVFVDKLSPGCAPQSTLSCWCYYAPNTIAPPYFALPIWGWLENRNTLWICTLNGPNTTVTLYTHELLSNTLVQRTQFFLDDVQVECMAYVPQGRVVLDDVSTEETVWMGSKNRLMIYSGSYPLVDKLLVSRSMKGRPVQMLHHKNRVYVGLHNGSVLIYQMSPTNWIVQMPLVVSVDVHPIASLLAINGQLYVASGTSVSMIDGQTDRLCGKIKDEDEHGDPDAQALTTPIICMAYSVNGMWLVRQKSSVVSLYRLSPWKHLQDIDVTGPVRRFSPVICQAMCEGNIFVTSIALVDNSLWIGTSVGVTMMMALPMHRNVPLIGDFLYGAKHGHLANVSMLLPLITGFCHDEGEAGYEAFDFPSTNNADDGDDGTPPMPTDNECDSTLSLYDTVWTPSERSSGCESADIELVPANASYTGTIPKPPKEIVAWKPLESKPSPKGSPSSTGTIPKPPKQIAAWKPLESKPSPKGSPSSTGTIPKPPKQTVAWHPLESKPSARGSPSSTGTIPKPPERALLAPEPRPVCAHENFTDNPYSVLILAGGEGYLNWHKWDTMDTSTHPMRSRVGPPTLEFEDDYNFKNSNIVVWEKRFDQSFQKFA